MINARRNRLDWEAGIYEREAGMEDAGRAVGVAAVFYAEQHGIDRYLRCQLMIGPSRHRDDQTGKGVG